MGVETASISANVERVCERIARAAERSGRSAAEITLVAVSKTFPAEKIREAYAAGLRHFGENRVQEWEAKRPHVEDLDARWHLVGHLQSNKAARAARIFHSIDSVDSLALAKKLDHAVALATDRGSEPPRGHARPLEGTGTSAFEALEPPTGARPFLGGQAAQRQQGLGGQGFTPDTTAQRPVGASTPQGSLRLPILIEVRLAPEETKSGVDEAGLPVLVECILALPHLDLRGLMCIPPFFEDPEKVRPHFRRLRELRDALRRGFGPACHSEPASAGEESQRQAPSRPFLHELSMGMSHDFEVAIEEGATQVRVGTAIFGPRPGDG